MSGQQPEHGKDAAYALYEYVTTLDAKEAASHLACVLGSMCLGAMHQQRAHHGDPALTFMLGVVALLAERAYPDAKIPAHTDQECEDFRAFLEAQYDGGRR